MPDPAAPTKVCPRCSVQSVTASATCPACGGSYVQRGSARRRAALLALPAALAIGAGYALAQAGEEDGRSVARPAATGQPTPAATAEPNAMTLDEVRSMPLDSTKRGVLDRLGPPKDGIPEGQVGNVPGTDECVYYNIVEVPQGDAQLCFKDGRLAAIATVY